MLLSWAAPGGERQKFDMGPVAATEEKKAEEAPVEEKKTEPSPA